MPRLIRMPLELALLAGVTSFVACGGNTTVATEAAPAAAPAPEAQAPSVPPASSTGGFDGQQAYQFTADQVAIGSRTAGTDGNHKAQQYIIDKLQSFGCTVDQQPFNASTPIGTVAMKNIIAKAPGASPDLLLYTGHYDTKMLPSFVGADDGGSSAAVMLEFARQVCKRQNALTVWIVFFDGEEAFNPDWKDPDNTYGSRELAARMALSGDIKRVKALVLVDMVGERNLVLKRESYSTPWLTDLVWSTAARLGYRDIFVSDDEAVEDDHQSFLRRNVPSVDIIDLDVPYWHTPQDTMDKVSARSLAVVGHVLMESLPALEQRFAKKAQ
jgi:Zn-dependent M28 family amino/carboxypeptidase